jgi:hypothetical protein
MVGFGLKQKEMDWVQYWNSFPFTPKHKNNNTKVYQRALRNINYLKHGSMFNACGADFVDWCLQYDIDKKILTAKWSDDNIKSGLINCSFLYNPEYYPFDKMWLPSLADLIYDPYLNNSVFLLYHNNPPKLKSDCRKENRLSVLTEKQKELLNNIQNRINNIRNIEKDDFVFIIRLMRDMKLIFEKKS